MRKIAVRELTPGMVLGRAVQGERGELMLAAQIVLNERFIALLRDRGFAAVYIEDPDTNDLEIEDVVSERVQAKITVGVSRVFEAMEQAATPFKNAALREMQGSDFARSIHEHAAYASLQHDIAELVDEVLNAETLTGLITLRSHDNYQFLHALDSTVTALMLGRRLRLEHDDLCRIAAGCLLHDIGMVTVDRAILERPDRLTTEEREKVREHPAVGYEMLRKLRPNEVIPNHVAFQHHERQDGTGYPRGLHGTNRVFRTIADRKATGRIVLDAEIVAVADVYDALCSDRPYRPGLPPDQVVRTMRRLAGGQLNRDVVAQLLTVLPIYPLGTEVVVVAGTHRLFRGIVSRVHREALDRPTVRLLWNAERARIRPLELDLRTAEDVIACVPFASEVSRPSCLLERAGRLDDLRRRQPVLLQQGIAGAGFGVGFGQPDVPDARRMTLR